MLRTGNQELAAISAGEPGEGWSPLAGAAFNAVASHLFTADGAPAKAAGIRYFTMRPQDLNAWDTLQRRGTGGYSYGFLLDDKGFAKNVQIKEVSHPKQMAGARPSFDPLAAATAIAVAQIQADIQRLTALVEQVAFNVKAILEFLHLGQEAEILAATETIDQIYARYCDELNIPSTDWDRLAGLEQVLKTQHRQIIGELDKVAKNLKFSTVDQAKTAAQIDAGRVEKLIHLEWYLLCSLNKWGELMLATKAGRGEHNLAAATEVRRLGEEYLDDARTVLREIRKADSDMAGRGIWERLFSHGLLFGWLKDNSVESDAIARRREVCQLTALRKRLPAPIAASPVRLQLEEASPPATVGATTA